MSETPESRHAVTNPAQCREMARKYRWKLLRIEPTRDKDLKFVCVFEGETAFPRILPED